MWVGLRLLIGICIRSAAQATSLVHLAPHSPLRSLPLLVIPRGLLGLSVVSRPLNLLTLMSPCAFPLVAPPLFVNSLCNDCGKCFNSVQKLAVHKKVKHGARDPIDLLVDTVFCPVCMLYFHDRKRLLNHLKYRSRLCKLNLLADGPLISPERALQLDLDNRELRRTRFAAGLRAHAAVVPAFRVQGPLPSPRIPILSLTLNSHVLGNGRRHYV